MSEHSVSQYAYASWVERYVQIISDVARKPFEKLRVLDLGSFEGGLSIELAERGATVVGVEAREANLAKAKFAKEARSLKNIDFFLDDVRNVNEKKYGRFDVVLCLGVLYHLNAPDVFSFLEKAAEICDGFMAIDTELSRTPEISYTYKGRAYWGIDVKEHEPTATQEEKLKNLWMSLDNVESFWFTRFSLINFLQHADFSSVYECANPPLLGRGIRTTFLAIKGRKVNPLLTSPVTRQVEEYAEVDSGRGDSELHLSQRQLSECQEQLARLRNHPYVKYGLMIRQRLKKL